MTIQQVMEVSHIQSEEKQEGSLTWISSGCAPEKGLFDSFLSWP
jgi:hypothetical protein